MATITAGQLFAIEIATRASSVASILGSLFIVSTFLCFPSFRKAPTRLILYTTFGNLVTNSATLISVSAIPADPTKTTSLCKAQAFLIQWFMLADPFWVFCMALNVWLVFYRRFDARDLHHHEKWYILFAYGIPALIAITYLIHDYNSRQDILGPAILWCWVSKDFDWIRIVFYYAPVWTLAGLIMSIYICLGARLYRSQVRLKKLARKSRLVPVAAPSSVVGDDPFIASKDKIVVTTEIEHDVDEDSSHSRSTSLGTELKSVTSTSSPTKSTAPRLADGSDTTRSSTPCSPSKPAAGYSLLVPLNPNSPHRHTKSLHISYRATAYAAPLASGEFATLPSPRVPVFRPIEHAAHVKRRKENAAALAYFNTAFLMFASLVVVWGPSSVNRLYQIAHPESPSYGLSLASALVLPMQGLWNATIYTSAVWPECKRAYAKVVSKLTGHILSKQSSNDSVRDVPIKFHGHIEDEETQTSFDEATEPNSSAQTV